MFVPVLVDLTFSVLLTWTKRVMKEWLGAMLRSNATENPLLKLQATSARFGQHARSNNTETDNGSLEYVNAVPTPGAYYHLYSETDPVCYSLSDLEDMEGDIISELREISMSAEDLDDSVFVSDEDNVI